MSARVALPESSRLLRYLARVDTSDHSRDNLFPILVEKLYENGSNVTGEQVGAALLRSISFYLNRLTGQTRRIRRGLMKTNLEKYLWAISYDFDGDAGQQVLDDAARYCQRHWDSVVT